MQAGYCTTARVWRRWIKSISFLSTKCHARRRLALRWLRKALFYERRFMRADMFSWLPVCSCHLRGWKLLEEETACVSNGRKDSSVTRKVFVKVAKANFSSPSEQGIPRHPSSRHKNKGGIIVVISVLFGSSAFVNIICLASTGFDNATKPQGLPV